MAYHHRTAAIALALALAAGVPAAAAAQQLGSPAPTSPCSEVCSGGGYPTAPAITTCLAYSLPTILNHLGSPPPCSDVCSGGGYGSASPPPQTPDNCSAYHPARIPPTAAHVITEDAGFHWGDAGIGAGVMLAVIVIVIGLGPPLTMTRRYSPPSHHDRPWTLPSPHPGPAVADDDLDIIGLPDHRPTRHTRPQ
jgi:hypothetical protein